MILGAALIGAASALSSDAAVADFFWQACVKRNRSNMALHNLKPSDLPRKVRNRLDGASRAAVFEYSTEQGKMLLVDADFSPAISGVERRCIVLSRRWTPAGAYQLLAMQINGEPVPSASLPRKMKNDWGSFQVDRYGLQQHQNGWSMSFWKSDFYGVAELEKYDAATTKILAAKEADMLARANLQKTQSKKD